MCTLVPQQREAQLRVHHQVDAHLVDGAGAAAVTVSITSSVLSTQLQLVALQGREGG